MHTVWNHDNVRISSIATVDISSGTTIRGTGAWGVRPFEFEATLTANGWSVAIIGTTGRKGVHDGATFNLILEVAAAAQRSTL